MNLRALRADAAIPARLLGIGLPLTIAAGVATAALLFERSGLWVAAAIVAPTDAAARYGAYASARLEAGHPAHGRGGAVAPIATRSLRRVGPSGRHHDAPGDDSGAA